MGREIRRVPPTWEHPKGRVRWSTEDHYLPLHDRSYAEECAAWKKGYAQWEAGTHPDQIAYPDYVGNTGEYWDYDGMPPDRDFYRPEWPEADRTAYQVYETVTEGTPISPVFATEDDLRAWLVADAHMTPEGADYFIQQGWTFSGLAVGGNLAVGLEVADLMAQQPPQ